MSLGCNFTFFGCNFLILATCFGGKLHPSSDVIFSVWRFFGPDVILQFSDVIFRFLATCFGVKLHPISDVIFHFWRFFEPYVILQFSNVISTSLVTFFGKIEIITSHIGCNIHIFHILLDFRNKDNCIPDRM